MNIEQARYNMIEQQIRPWDVLDQKVLDTLLALPREQFVPPEHRNLAFADLCLPFGDIAKHPDQVMLEPKMEARLVQSLQLSAAHSVMVVGAGTGFVVGLIAKLAKSVVAYEINSVIAELARRQLANANITNATVITGDGLQPASTAEFNRILLTGSVREVPSSLFHRLALFGELIAVVGNPPILQTTRFNHQGGVVEVLFDAFVPRLQYVEETAFVF